MKSGRKKLLIMIVDDDEDIRESLKDAMESEDHDIVLAENAAQAIALASENPPDIAFIDMMLPVLVGHEVFFKLKKINPDMFGIMMTGYREEMSELLKLAKEGGAYSILYKPQDLRKAATLVYEIKKKIVEV